MKTLIALTILNGIISGTTLSLVIIAGKKAQREIQQTKNKANDTLANFRDAVNKIPNL